MQQLQTILLLDLMQYAQSVCTKLLKINMEMRNEQRMELCCSLILQEVKELKTHNTTTKSVELKELKSINLFSLLKNASERWTVKFQEVMFRLDKLNSQWF